MKTKPRWMKSVIEAAQDQTAPLPIGRKAQSIATELKAVQANA